MCSLTGRTVQFADREAAPMETARRPVPRSSSAGCSRVQAAANVQLAGRADEPVRRLGAAARDRRGAAARAGRRRRLARRVRRARRRRRRGTLVGGLGSALYITAGILLFPRVGALVAVGLFVAGQMLASLAARRLRLARRRARAAGRGRASPAPRASSPASLARSCRRRAAPRSGARRVGRRSGCAAGAGPRPCRARSTPGCAPTLDAPIAVGARSRSSSRPPRWRSSSPAARGDPRAAAASRRCAACRGGAGSAALCGATYVTSMFLLIPEIGAAPTVGADRRRPAARVGARRPPRACCGSPRRPITARRLAGVATLLAGVALVTAGG